MLHLDESSVSISPNLTRTFLRGEVKDTYRYKTNLAAELIFPH
jgi:hypothetical protein